MKWKNIDCGTTTFFITGIVTEWQPLLHRLRTGSAAEGPGIISAILVATAF